jgi:hypothetical protein
MTICPSILPILWISGNLRGKPDTWEVFGVLHTANPKDPILSICCVLRSMVTSGGHRRIKIRYLLRIIAVQASGNG